MNIKCIIIDDEPLAVEILEAYIEKVPYLQLMGSFNNSLDALQYMKSNHVDLLLLDIQMPELTGFQLMSILDNPPLVIFTTAFNQYAIKSYELEAVDYLLKPFDLERFLKAVEKVWKRKSNGSSASASSPENVTADTHTSESFIFIRTEHRLQRVEKKDILYIEGMKNYLRVITPAGKYMTLMSFKNMEDLLSGPRFIRVHKSFIVALDKIDSVERGRIRIGKVFIPIGDKYRKEVESIIGMQVAGK
ncbi:MAG TPA: response regulator transcription factor [Bacteroidales bacterium]|mgnify:CR=1 FL=1|nr:response regulator transcription factor [Bacteroidales bacterium]